MFKSTILAGFLALSTLSATPAFAGQRENFDTCVANSSSWMNRWGKYVVSFDLAQAYNVCRKKAWPQDASAKQAGCYANGAWLKAGYYCQVIEHGQN
jgi:hypothetical protein